MINLTEIQIAKVGIANWTIMKDYCIKQIETLQRHIEELSK